MDGRRLGSIVGTIGGLGFVLGSAGAVPWSMVWRVLAVALALAVAVALVRSTAPAPPAPSREGVRRYGFSVLALVVAIPVGARLLALVDGEDLVRVWVVLVVGLHFVPFTRAFGTPLFTALAWSLVAVAVLGLVLSAVLDEAPAATAVVAGNVLLGFALGGLLPRPGRR